MVQKWSALVGLFAALALLTSLSSCGRDRQLVTITIQPASATFLSPNAGGQIQFTAIGSYIHPPISKDITNEVTWKTNVSQIINLNAGAVTTTGNGCGIANISAGTTRGTGPSGNLIIGYATVTVNDAAVSTCPGGTTTQGAVLVSLSGSGSVASVPGGITCPTTCGALFQLGTTVVLNATPGSGATTVVWGNCTASGNSCSVVVGPTPVTVTAHFQ